MINRGGLLTLSDSGLGRLSHDECRPPVLKKFSGASTDMLSTSLRRYHAFLSFNSQDRPAVRVLAERLKGEGLVPYLEEWELAPGQEVQPALADGLRDSQTCVVFLGPNGLGPWQKQELQVAIDMRARDGAFRVIPVLLPGAERPRAGTWHIWSSS